MIYLELLNDLLEDEGVDALEALLLALLAKELLLVVRALLAEGALLAVRALRERGDEREKRKSESGDHFQVVEWM